MDSSFYSFLWLLGEFSALIAFIWLTTLLFERTWTQLKSLYSEKRAPWSSTFFSAWHLPALFIIWSFVLCLELKSLINRWGIAPELYFLEKLWPLSLIALLTWGCLRWKGKLQRWYLAQVPASDSIAKATVDLVSKSTSIVLLLLSVLTALQVLEIPWQALLALSSGGLVALGFAAKDMAANLFGGAMLYLTRPFTIGNFISIPDKRLEGEVEIIGWYQTRIRNLDKMPLYVPNGVFTQNIVINTSRITHRKLSHLLSLRLEDIDKIPEIIAGLQQILLDQPGIDAQMKPTAFLAAITTSVDIQVTAFSYHTDWGEFRKMQQEILLQCSSLIQEKGGYFAIPQRVIFSKPE